jgi:hypothetical protein
MGWWFGAGPHFNQVHRMRRAPILPDLGYRWAALQIPVQYLPWTVGHRSTRDAEAALDQIEQALGHLSA